MTACRRKECLVGFALFLAPAGSAAAINLFSGLGPQFHASEHTVVLVTGVGCAIVTSIGALAGGYAANHLPRGYLFLGAAAGIAGVSITLALTGHTVFAFIAGALVYNGLTGVVYASFNALAFQLTGQQSPVASTQLALFTASFNAAVVYMTWADGQGFGHFGVRGLFLVDGLACAAAVIPLLVLVKGGLTGARTEAPIVEV